MQQPKQILHGPLTQSTTSISWVPELTGVYHIVVGAGSPVWSTGAVTVSQDGLALTDLSALTAATRKLVHLVTNVPVVFSVATPGATTSVAIRTTLDPEWLRRS